MDEIVKAEVSNALTVKPLEWLKKADEVFVEAMTRMSAAMIQECDSSEVAAIHDWTKKSEKSIQMFKDNARERLLSFILAKGEKVTDKGTLQISLDNGRVQRAIPTNTKPADRLTERMLRAKGLSIETYMNKVVKYTADERKLQTLLDTEQITTSEFKSCFDDISYRIGASEVTPEDEE